MVSNIRELASASMTSSAARMMLPSRASVS